MCVFTIKRDMVHSNGKVYLSTNRLLHRDKLQVEYKQINSQPILKEFCRTHKLLSAILPPHCNGTKQPRQHNLMVLEGDGIRPLEQTPKLRFSFP